MVRVVVDTRPMQEPERSPLTAWYLRRLLAACAATPVEGESFVLVSRAFRADPAAELEAAGLPVAASRRVPPTTRALRSAGLTLDSFLLRGAEIGTGTGEEGAVFHTAGGVAPLASRLPVVATILDLAPWELPQAYQATAAARFATRLRARVLRDAARVIVCSRAVAEFARRRLHVPADRLVVVPLAVDGSLSELARDVETTTADRKRLGLPGRYLAFIGRYDARKDLRTLLQAMSELQTDPADAAGGGRRGSKGPPALVLGIEGTAEERQRAERLIDALGVRATVSIVPVTDERDRAAVLSGAHAAVQPCLSDAVALGAREAVALGVPVIATRAGSLPETVGSAGIIVEPRDPARMAAAIAALWSGGSLAQQLRRQARRRADADSRTWADVAAETRAAYAAAARSAAAGSG